MANGIHPKERGVSKLELLAEIKDADIGVEAVDEQPYWLRRAARVVLMDGTGQIALLHVARKHYHKLPGGGMEAGESVEEALYREVLEETGVALRILEPVGAILEVRARHEFMQMSYGFLGEAEEVRGSPTFSRSELEEGFELKWMPWQDALASLASDRPADYVGKFVQKRDLLLLRQAFAQVHEGKTMA